MTTFLMRVWPLRDPSKRVITPTGQTFSDVKPGDWYYPFAESIARYGVRAAWCAANPPSFCPAQALKRAELADWAIPVMGY